jgi:6-phosphogluconolactonase (cycloisomerase 2 family)
MAKTNLLVAALASSASAVRLFATTYAAEGAKDGVISTLEFQPGDGQGAASLKSVAQNTECGSAPTWMDISLDNGLLYCLDEGWATPNASINTLQIAEDGSLKRIKTLDTIQGPVTIQFYNDNKAMVLAHYGAQATSTFTVSEDKTTFTPLQNFTYSTPPGPNPNQEASHPHQATLVIPDLGSDVVRVYCIDPENSHLNEHESLKVKPGYGPRHIVFWSPDEHPTNETTYMYTVNELYSRMTTYRVGYLASGGLVFTQIEDVSMYGPDHEIPAGGRAAEIAVSPDNRFIVASNRNATLLTVPNQDPNNSTAIPSDTLIVFKPKEDGKLEFVQLAPSGGSFPRHFSFNKDGTLIAVGNQNSFTVDIFSRNVETGEIGDRVASLTKLPGQVNNVIWDEE